jgi:NADPH:quinone reductase-like Zn-dependent oxidoreductase
VKAQGAISIATTRTSSKKQLLVDFGADHVIATQEEDLPARVREITDGKLARVAFDAIGGSHIDTLAQKRPSSSTANARLSHGRKR